MPGPLLSLTAFFPVIYVFVNLGLWETVSPSPGETARGCLGWVPEKQSPRRGLKCAWFAERALSGGAPWEVREAGQEGEGAQKGRGWLQVTSSPDPINGRAVELEHAIVLSP